MNRILRCGAIAVVLLSSACVTKLFDREYEPPRGVPVTILKFMPMERGSYTIELLRGERWLQLHGEVREQRKTGGGGGAFDSDFQAQRSEVVAGQPTTLALIRRPATPTAEPCRVQLLICGAEDTLYEVVMEAGDGSCSGYFLQQSISDAGVLRRERLSPEEAADCAREAQP